MEVVEETTITNDGGGRGGSVDAAEEEEMKEMKSPPSRKPPSILPPRPPSLELEMKDTLLSEEGEGEGGEGNDVRVTTTSAPEEKQHQPTREEKVELEEEEPTQEKEKEKEAEKEVEVAKEEPKEVEVTREVHDKRREEEEGGGGGGVRTVVAESPLPTPRIVEPDSSFSPPPPSSEATPHETEEDEKVDEIGEETATGTEAENPTTTIPSRPPPKRSPPPSPKVSSSHPVFNAKRAPHLGGKTQHQSFLNVFTSPAHALKPIPVFSSPSPSNSLSPFSSSPSSASTLLSSSPPSVASSFASSLFPPTPASPTRTRHSLCGPTSLQQVHSPHPLSVQLGISLNLSGDLSGEIETGNNNNSSSSLVLSSSPGSGDISNSPSSSSSVAIGKMPFTARPMRQLESLSFDPPSLRRCFSEPFFNSWDFYPSVSTRFRKEEVDEVDSLKNVNEEEEDEEEDEEEETEAEAEGKKVVLQKGEEESTPRLPSEVEVDDGAGKNVKVDEKLNEGGEESPVVNVITEERREKEEEVLTKEADAKAEAIREVETKREEEEESLILKSSPSLTDLSPIAQSVSASLEERTPTTTVATTEAAGATTTTVEVTEGKTLVSSDSKEVMAEDPRELRRRDSSAKRTLIKKEINGKQVIVAGDIEQLISSLAPEDVLDADYIDDFLISYRYFLTPTQLMSHLETRYEYLPTGFENEEEIKRRKQWEGPIRLRVINILRNWLNKHYYDFKNVDLTKQLLDFVDRVISVNNKKWADQLHLILQEQVDSIVKGVLSRDSALPVIKAAMKKHEAGLLMRYKKDPSKRVFSAARAITWLVTNLSLIHRIEGVAIGNRMIQAGLLCHVSKPKATFIDNEEEYYFFIRQTNEPEEEVYPKPMIDKSIFESSNNTSFVLTDLHPLEVARQLTLAEFNLFKAITPTEIKSQAWNKKNWQEVSPNVYSIIQKFNRVGLWVATEIVTEHNPSKRKEVLRRCIEIADALRKLQNWNTLFAVISGLNQSSVSRLKRTWAGLGKKPIQTFAELNDCSNPEHNFKAYREVKNTAGDVPFLPYLGLYLRDLTFIEDGNPDELEGGEEGKMINFEKMRMISKVFAEIQKYQMGKRFVFKRLSRVQDWLDNTFVMQEKELYDISIKNEAREEGGSVRGPSSSLGLTPSSSSSSSTSGGTLGKSRKKLRTAVQGLF